jgi:hypothetical protein
MAIIRYLKSSSCKETAIFTIIIIIINLLSSLVCACVGVLIPGLLSVCESYTALEFQAFHMPCPNRQFLSRNDSHNFVSGAMPLLTRNGSVYKISHKRSKIDLHATELSIEVVAICYSCA